MSVTARFSGLDLVAKIDDELRWTYVRGDGDRDFLDVLNIHFGIAYEFRDLVYAPTTQHGVALAAVELFGGEIIEVDERTDWPEGTIF